MKFILLCVFAAVWACASAAMADVITQKQEFSGLSPDGCHYLTFDKFNNADGTLMSIEITFSLTITGGKLILDNDDNDAVSGTLEFGYDASAFLSGCEIINNVFYSQDFSLAGNEGDGIDDYDTSPPDGLLYNGGSKNGIASGNVNSIFYSSYTGIGNYNITVNLATRLECGESGDLKYGTPEYVNPEGYVEVVYNYTPIPEPATVALLCFGGVFVILGSKKRK